MTKRVLLAVAALAALATALAAVSFFWDDGLEGGYPRTLRDRLGTTAPHEAR